jgi:2-polyprenyl-6-methoxyphenol hydroxylase-like FAD-dependent oxidoreductase
VAQQRAPWFDSPIKQVHWCTEVSFERRLVTQFGRKRCWLAGDAAHQTGPVGVQSMNLGFSEANALASLIRKFLREAASLESLQNYDREWQKEWQSLFGLGGGLKPRGAENTWTARHSARILPCLPCSGADLTDLSSQLGLGLAWSK